MPVIQSSVQSPAADKRPLCVDLDGTLIRSDSLIDSLLVLTRNHPTLLFGLIGPLFRGKAAFKAFVNTHVTLDVVHLPYNNKVVDYLREEHARGRAIYLATGANQELAARVSTHLGLFTDVLGSDATTNLTGSHKLDRLRTRLGPGAFDYIGNDTPDLPIMASASETMVANPSLRLRLKLRARGMEPTRAFEERNGLVQSIVNALRPHQWAKNLLMFLPLLLAHIVTLKGVLTELLAFCCFCLTASAAYIVNDLLDIEVDRRHFRKQHRPFASGNLSAVTGLCLVVVLLALALAGALFLPVSFLGWLALYLVGTLAYSFYLKRIAIVDVLVLSGLYTLRIESGGAATQTPISHWMAGFSIFLFLALAFVKRFVELESLRSSDLQPRNGRGYLSSDIEVLRTFGTASSLPR